MNEPAACSPLLPDDSHLDVPAVVGRMLAASRFGSTRIERRTSPRFDYPHMIYLTPLDSLNRPAPEETIVALGKRISARGVDFVHHLPLPFRRAIVSLRSQNGTWSGFYTVLKWCRFIESGYYDNGGLFTTIANSPLPLVDEEHIAKLEREIEPIREKIAESDTKFQFLSDSSKS